MRLLKLGFRFAVGSTLVVAGCSGVVRIDYVCPDGTDRRGGVCVEQRDASASCAGCSDAGADSSYFVDGAASAASPDGGEAPADAGEGEPYPLFECQTLRTVIRLVGDEDHPLHPGREDIYQSSEWPNWSIKNHESVVTIDAYDGPKTFRVQFRPPLGAGPLRAWTSYDGAEYAFDAGAGLPGLYVGLLDEGACRSTRGRFRIGKYEVQGGNIAEFTASFEQYCEGMKGALRGCVHVSY